MEKQTSKAELTLQIPDNENKDPVHLFFQIFHRKTQEDINWINKIVKRVYSSDFSLAISKEYIYVEYVISIYNEIVEEVLNSEEFDSFARTELRKLDFEESFNELIFDTILCDLMFEAAGKL